MIKKEKLEHLYIQEKRSMKEISSILNCSANKISYWMVKHEIPRRSISDGVYIKNNPEGDPFVFRGPKNREEAILYGMGLGIYWGEGTKMNKYSVRLGNTDPELIKIFIKFLECFFAIKHTDLRFSIQVFSDVSAGRALDFWAKELSVERSQFSKTTITPARAVGNYRHKNIYGVLMVYYHNRKMRDKLVGLLPESKIQPWYRVV